MIDIEKKEDEWKYLWIRVNERDQNSIDKNQQQRKQGSIYMPQ